MSIDSQSLDAMVTAIGWVLGLSCVLVAGSVLGLTTWWLRALESPSLLALFGRSGLALFGIGLLTLGVGAITIGLEAATGYPFGPSSGGLVLYAYLIGMWLLKLEVVNNYGLLREHTVRTDSGLSRVLATFTFAAAAGLWIVTGVLTFVVFVVSLNMAAFTMGWTGP